MPDIEINRLEPLRRKAIEETEQHVVNLRKTMLLSL